MSNPSILATIASEGLTQHKVYWFHDGSLVFRIQNHLFKVHRTLISRHSLFFASKIAKYSADDVVGSNVAKIADGMCIYMDVERDVSANDVEALLGHLYHDVPLGRNLPFQRVASVIRASSPNQLDFPNIHSVALESLEAMFTTYPESFSLLHPLHESLNLATKYKLPLVRKAVFYSLVTTTNFDIEERADKGPTVDPIEDHTCGILSESDAWLCRRLLAHIIDHFTPTLFTPATTAHMACTDVFADMWMPLVITPALADDGVYKPLETLERIKSIDWATKGLCASCLIEKRQEWTEEQYTVWRLISGWLEKLDAQTARKGT